MIGTAAALLGGASILGGLYASSQNQKAAKAASKQVQQGEAQFQQYAGQAENAATAGYDQASSQIAPYATGGQNAFDLYLAATGAKGTPAQQDYYNTFQDDPGFQKALEQGQNAIEHSRIVHGTSNSGGAMRELYTYGENARLGAYKDRLAQLSSLSQIGLGAAGTSAQLAANKGTTLADIALKRGGSARDTGLQLGNIQQQGIANSANALVKPVTDISNAYFFGAGKTAGATPGAVPSFYLQ
jgi:hypothetical protein